MNSQIFDWIFENQNYIRYSVFALVFIALTLLILGINKKGVLKNAVGTFLDNARRNALTRNNGRYVSDYIKHTEFLDETYKYSRIYATPVGKKIGTSYYFFLANIIISGIVTVVAIVLTRNLAFLFLFPVAFFLIYFGLYIQRVRMAGQASKDLILFLNLIGNYSTCNTEVTDVFMQIAPKLSEPLASCLIECCAEAQGGVLPEIALKNLANKIEPRRFKEIIKGITIAQKYSSSFTETVNSFRNTLQAHVGQQKERQSVVFANVITGGAVAVGLMTSLFFVGNLLNLDILHELTGTLLGNAVIGVSVITTIIATIRMIGALKN